MATTGDSNLATSGDFFMATDNWPSTSRFAAAGVQPGLPGQAIAPCICVHHEPRPIGRKKHRVCLPTDFTLTLEPVFDRMDAACRRQRDGTSSETWIYR